MKESVKEDLLGFELRTGSPTDGGSGITVYLYHKEYRFSISVTGEYLKEFGYYVAGPCLGIIGMGDEYTGTYEDRIKATISILSKKYSISRKEVNYHVIKDFINSKELPTKRLKDAFKFSFKYLLEEYQDLWKFAEKQAIEDEFK